MNKENQEEIWKDVKNYEGLYQVSNLGRIKSLNYNHTNKEKILELFKNNQGYMIICLHKKGRQKTFRVHRLVAEAFIPNPKNKPEIDHINTIRDDNRVENLRWVTRKENSNNELTKQKYKEMNLGEKHPLYGKKLPEETKRKLSESLSGKNNPMYGKYGSNNPNAKNVYCVELNKTWKCIKECAEELGLHDSNITMCCKGVIKTTGKMHFKYV